MSQPEVTAPMDPFVRRPLGTTGLAVTAICLGAAPLGDMADVFGSAPGETQAVATVEAALRSPLRFLDTAAGYGDGTSERRVGMGLRANGGIPDDFLVATKADPDATTRDFSGDQCRRSIERSQRLLGMDHLPLIYLHDPEYHDDRDLTRPGGAVDVLVELRDAGVIGAIGLAGGEIATMHRYLELGVFSVMLTHNRYNLVNRSGDALIDAAVARGMAVCNAAPFGGGILARGATRFPRFMYRDAAAVTLGHATAFEDLAARHSVPLAAVALQFSLRDPRISSTVVGMSRPERVDETLRLARLPIPAELWDELAGMPYSIVEGI